jgi:hypothetical protein
VRFLFCGGRLRVDVVELGDEVYEVFSFVKGGTYDILDVLKKEGFICLKSENKEEKVLSKVVEGNVIDYLTMLSVMVAKEMKKWREC